MCHTRRRSNRSPRHRNPASIASVLPDRGAQPRDWRTAELHLDWCSYAAARHAVENWHYSGRLPVGKIVRIGVWERGRFVGVVLFGRGACPQIGCPFKLKQTRVCELVRVALSDHVTPVSRIIAIALRMLARQSRGVRLIVSYADEGQGHHGGIYQAGNWLYIGAAPTHRYRVRGKLEHGKTLASRYGIGGQSVRWLRAHVDPRARRVPDAVKHKYIMPLDARIRRRVAPLSQPYPARRKC